MNMDALKCITAVLLLVPVVACAATTGAPATASREVTPASSAPPSKKMPKPFVADSWAKLNGAANLLMVVADGSLVPSCKVTPDEALRWINPLHAMIDEQVEVEAKAALKNPKEFAISRQLDTCEKRCECGQLASVLEAAPKAFGLKKLAALQSKAAAQTPAQLKACAQKEEKWFCTSDLRHRLDLASKQ